jgi:hypothetical protein
MITLAAGDSQQHDPLHARKRSRKLPRMSQLLIV